jgi:hypothetical protein
MKRHEVLMGGIRNGLYKHFDWIVSIFAITREDPDAYKKGDSYTYRVVQTPTGNFSVGHNDPSELILIDDAPVGEPLFKFNEKITVDQSVCQNIREGQIETTIGQLLFNKICLVEAFGNKIPYVTGKVTVSALEAMIAEKLVDNPKESESTEDPNVIYVREYLAMVDSFFYLERFAQLCAWAATEKTMVPPTGIESFKKELLVKYAGKLTDPVELSKYEKELQDFDDAYLKDDPSYGAFTSGKIKNIARKKMFLGLGAEDGFTQSLNVTPVINSLEEGWPTEPTQYTAMMNASRAGSFSRGAETVKGGVSAKVMLRAAGNIKIVDTDCGTTLGIHRDFDESNIKQLVGREIRVKNEWITVKNLSDAEHLMGRSLIVRSPMFCKLDGDNLCSHCAGEKLAENKNGVSIALTEISSKIMTALLKAMHGKVLSTAKMNYQKALT